MPKCKPVESSFDVSIPWGGEHFEFTFTMTAELELAFQQAMKGPQEWDNEEMWPVILGALSKWNVEGPGGGALKPNAENFMRYVPRIVRTATPRFFVAVALRGSLDLTESSESESPEFTNAQDPQSEPRSTTTGSD